MGASIGVAVIGAGMAGRAHAAAYRSASTFVGTPLPAIRLVSIADTNADFARETARRYGYERADTDWRAIATDPAIDAVSVAVANALHREIVGELLAAGKHVLCEKPLAPSVADAEAMVADAEAVVADDQGIARIAAVGFTYRRAPAIEAIRGLVEAGTVGRVTHFNGRYWSDYASDPGGPMGWRYTGGPGSGALLDIGSHLVDLAEMICGPIASVGGAVLSTFIAQRRVPVGAVVGHTATTLSDVKGTVDNEDVVTFTARFASGAVGTFSVSRVAYGAANSLGFEVFGEHGAVMFDMERPGELGLVDGSAPASTRGVRRVLLGPDHPYLADWLPMPYRSVGYSQNDLFVLQARAFLEQVAGIEGLPSCATFADGLRNLRLAAAVVASAAAGGTEVAVDGSGAAQDNR